MDKIRQLIERRNKLIAQQQEMLDQLEKEERADFNEEEEARYTALAADIDGLKKQIDRRTEQRAQEMPAQEQRAEENDDAAKQEELAFRALLLGDRASEEEKQARANTTVTDNGAVIGATIVNRILHEVENICPIYEGATKFHFKGTVKFPVVDETSSGTCVVAFASEFTDLTASTAKLDTIDLSGYLFGALTLVSRSLINNAEVDIVSFVITQMAIGLKRFLELKCLKGESGKMTGILSSTNTVTAGAAAAVTADDLVNLIGAIPKELRKDCRFVMNSKTETAVRKLKDGENRYLFLNDATTGFQDRLLGFPVDISDALDDVAASKKPIIFCDYSGLYVNIREDVSLQVLREKYATQHADGFVLWGEMDSKIVEAQKIAVLATPAS